MIKFWREPSAKVFAASLSLIGLIDVLLLSQTEIHLANGTVSAPVKTLLIAACVCLICLAALARLKGDSAKSARAISFVALSVYCQACLIAALTFFGALTTLGTYLAVTLGFPFQDAAYAWLDRRLGFDWLAVLRWANSSTALAGILYWTYHSAMYQLLFVTVLLPFTPLRSQMWDFPALLSVTGLFTVVISGLAPAVAPYTFYQPATELYETLASYRADVGRDFVEDVMALHAGQLRSYSLEAAKGIVTFPSFHAVIGMVVVYAVRNVALLFWPAVILNAVMLIATVPVGGHYAIDVIGGCVVFLAALTIVDWANGREPIWVSARTRQLRNFTPAQR